MEMENKDKRYIKSGLDRKFGEYSNAFGTKIFYENYSGALSIFQIIKVEVYLEAEFYNIRGVITDKEMSAYGDSINNLEKHLETPDAINELKKYKLPPFKLEYYIDRKNKEGDS